MLALSLVVFYCATSLLATPAIPETQLPDVVEIVCFLSYACTERETENAMQPVFRHCSICRRWAGYHFRDDPHPAHGR